MEKKGCCRKRVLAAEAICLGRDGTEPSGEEKPGSLFPCEGKGRKLREWAHEVGLGFGRRRIWRYWSS